MLSHVASRQVCVESLGCCACHCSQSRKSRAAGRSVCPGKTHPTLSMRDQLNALFEDGTFHAGLPRILDPSLRKTYGRVALEAK